MKFQTIQPIEDFHQQERNDKSSLSNMNAKKGIISNRSKHKKNYSEFPATGNYMNEKLDP